MKRVALVMVLLAMLGADPAGAAGPPANDDFASATPIPATIWNTTVDTTGATLEPGEPATCGGMTKSVWYSFTTNVEMDLMANTQGTSFPTAIAAYKGPTRAFVGCDSHEEALSDVQLTTEPGVTYYFQMGPTTEVDGVLSFNFRYMYRVSGTVRDAQGNPVSGVCAISYDMNGTTTYHTTYPITKADGTYTIKYLYPGDHKVKFEMCSATSTRFRDQWYDGKATFAEGNVVVSGPDGGPTETTGVDATLQKRSAIIGTLTDRRGKPAPYTCIDVYRNGSYVNYAYTDESGEYSIPVNPNSGYKVSFATCEEGYVPEWYDDAATQAAATPLTVGTDEWVTANAVLDPMSTISGRITRANGDPVAWECVDILDASGNVVRETYSDGDGNYDARGLDSGSYAVRFAGCSWAQHMVQWYHGSLTESGATRIAITGTSHDVVSIDDVLDRGGVIRGTITDTTGEKVKYDCVGLYDLAGNPVKSTTTGSQGTYSFRALQPGSYKIRFGGCTDKWLPRWHDDKTGPADADPVVASLGTETVVDAVLPVRAAPANDARASGAAITGEVFRDTRDTLAATREANEPTPCAETPPNKTVWYRFTPPQTGVLRLWTLGSDYDTMLGAYLSTGSGPADGVAIACADARSGAVGEQLDVPVVAGQTIDIQVGGVYGGGTLKFTAQFFGVLATD